VRHSNCSVCLPPTTSFSATPIGTLDALARMLKHSVEELQDIATTADQRYRVVRVPKDGGGFRECFDALGLLKSIHGRLLHMILERVNYPLYLQGSIKDRTSPRGQKANAEQHISPETLITVDIKSFFPLVKRPIIFDIWHRFFRFPPRVADILATLTTRDGCLPQGTKTSALLANLVFWDIEWQVVSDFHERGIRYTRLIDDVSCSSKTPLTHEEMSYVITKLQAMVRQKGLRLHSSSKKKGIAHANQQQVTTKLVVNRKTSLLPDRRSATRVAVHALRRVPSNSRDTAAYLKKYRHASGLVSYLQQHHPREGQQLRDMLKSIPPQMGTNS
jgi:Reverse transcriptase (RNA-dependent DNA polymerase)